MAESSLLELEDPRWRAFVAGRPEATPFHHPAWSRLLADCYGFRAFALALPGAGGAIAAGVPVLEVRGVRSRRWLALPFTDACGPLGEPAAVPELVAALDERRREAGIGAAEIRAAVESPLVRRVQRGFAHALPLGSNAEAVRSRFDRSQVQRGIARSERDGVVVRAGSSADDLLEIFYRLHLATRRRQGVPVQPRRFFELLWERLLEPGLGWVLVSEHEGRAVAAAVFLAWNGTLVYKLGASDAARLACRPNHALFWCAIRRGCDEGHRVLDLGRTDLANEGLRAFKAGWGARETVLVHSSFGSAPVRSHAPAALAAVIRRSPPWVCRTLGERLYRYAA